MWRRLAEVGVDMDDVADQLEREGVASFQKSFDELLDALAGEGRRARRRLTPDGPSDGRRRTSSGAAPTRGSSRSSTRPVDRRIAVELLGAALGLLERPIPTRST